MSALLIVFTPVIVAGVALAALLLGAAAAGTWESLEEHARTGSRAAGPHRAPAPAPSAPRDREGPRTRAA